MGRFIKPLCLGCSTCNLSLGLVGFYDDLKKIREESSAGISARLKFLLQSLIGFFASLYLVFSIPTENNSQALILFQSWLMDPLMGFPEEISLTVPFFKDFYLPLGLFGFVILSYFVIVGTSNAVNLTDGLDGLAILPSVLVASGLGIFAMWLEIFSFLNIFFYHISQVLEN